ncbi:hypothetical protein [Paenibacillus crassostreae]|uniref:Replicative helicase inhibitor G39P N-terminal domain-containing protein n=1 Tax=Paenibacillus crassostreae TaxID=1763538 RepID=A0A167C6A4_9BACL|nr:hypothetical protein [Paenibacillus crassostreae]AOZ91594.1 hypothetical protein LPB68_04770 [Paenibacillus crassostreae]OAB72831.1 hypothetical protein PNBC_15480 [Paenibacillus crassostreae]
MKLITNVYQNFEVNDSSKIEVWTAILRETDVIEAKQNLMDHFRTNKFPPTPADIIRSDRKQSLSVYEVQRLETEQHMFELKEYQENEDVKPMPDYIKKQLRELRMKVISDES